MEIERFNELVKESAVVYWLFRGDVLLVDTTLINKISDIGIEYLDETYHCNLTVNISDLYELRDDVEEEREFGSVFRTERLIFPYWSDVLKGEDISIHFQNKRKDISYELYVDAHKGGIFIEKDHEVIWLKNLTRENYNEARRKCVQLFQHKEKNYD
ncbi:MAG: hypothetical protein IJA23_06075 [Clostridia bacterium]|nr:hypothetical protein [Clostridia bacterium]